MLYVVIGPEKSGKSVKAEELAVSLGSDRVYLATMIPHGEEGARRVERHQNLRKEKGFWTIECSRNIAAVELEGRPVVLLECIVNLVANELFERDWEEKGDLVDHICEDLLVLQQKCRHLVVVTSEIASSDQYDDQTNEYVRIVKMVNQRICQMANQVLSVTRQETAFFPIFIDLRGKRTVVVGAGEIAARRAEILADFGAAVFVVAPGGCAKMEKMDQQGVVHWDRRNFQAADLNGAFLVIAVTDQPDINRLIVKLCNEKQILVNHAGDQSQCGFYFPGVAREGYLSAGVTTSGRDHKLAKQLAKKLRIWLKELKIVEERL